MSAGGLTEPMRGLLARLSDDWADMPRRFDLNILRALYRRGLFEHRGNLKGHVRRTDAGRAALQLPVSQNPQGSSFSGGAGDEGKIGP